MEAPVKIACIQMAPEYRQKEKNLQKAENFLLEAIEQGTQLLVLPEVFNVGSAGNCRQDAYDQAESVPGGETVQRLCALSQKHGVYICGSMIEQDGVDLYNTAVLVGPEGFIGKYRKMHLCSKENFFYEPGDLGIPVFHTKLGRIALLVCLDLYYPETVRIAALKGADIVCASFAGGDYGAARGYPQGMHTVIPALAISNSVSNHIYIVACDQVGTCNGALRAGQSIITKPDGAPVAGVASHDKEEILYATVDLADTRRRFISATNSRLGKRRTDVYDAMLGYREPETGKR